MRVWVWPGGFGGGGTREVIDGPEPEFVADDTDIGVVDGEAEAEAEVTDDAEAMEDVDGDD